MGDLKHKALDLLQLMLGEKATFRDGQWEAIESIIIHKNRTLVVQRTGWGKSIIYFIASKMLRDQGLGVTLIISPLLSLMRNQVESAERIGVHAATINSSNMEEWNQIEKDLHQGSIDVLLISPERLANQDFLNLLSSMREAIAMLVIDEAHCISDWGHDFRPDYRRIVDIIKTMPPNIPILATTATANSRVVKDIAEQLGPNLLVSRGPLLRESLRLQIIRLKDQSERLAWLAENLNALPGSGIIYCLTRADCRRVSEWLKSKNLDVAEYTGKSDSSLREVLEQRLLKNEVKALVATVALGMGFDKPDLGFVIHYQRPSSVTHYYQQIGRAGRALDTAYAILLAGHEDDEIGEYFIETALPSYKEMSSVVKILEVSESGLTISQLLTKVNYSKGRIERVLKLLEIEGIIAKNKSTYYRTLNPWNPDSLHYDEITELRRKEMSRMQEFTLTSECYMEFLSKELDDPHAKKCYRCANCSGNYYPSDVNPKLVQEAVHFLRRSYLPIEPRKQWPAGGIGHYKGKIKDDLRNEEGKILCMYGDAGWGRLVAQNKFVDGYFSDELVKAMRELIASWSPSPYPSWVTAVPSLRRPNLVLSLAQRLADELGLPFIPCIKKVKETAEQKTMNNSMRQALNLVGAFKTEDHVPEGSVFLVDDMIDSGWTMTICGALLLEAGSGSVFPIALASTAGRGNDD